MTAAALKTPAVILRTASGEPPLGPSDLAFRDDQGEIFLHDNERYRTPATRLGVLELESGHWLALPPGFHIDAPRFEGRNAALRTGIARLIRKARRYARAKDGEGTHWTEGFSGRVIEWALSLKAEKDLDHLARESDAAPIGHPGPEKPNPYMVQGPALISFSGGRTSAYMLQQILQAHGGKLPEDVHVTFTNTGRELEKTLRFIHNCEANFGVKVHWLERTPDGGFVEVGYNSASRSGEPFAALIAKKQYTPNAVTRFCTVELKIRVMRDFARSLGWERWNNLVGLRYDEGHRVLKALERNDRGKERFKAVMPLSKAKVTKRDVMQFWLGDNADPVNLTHPLPQGFDLGLRDYEGNCDLCFLKSRAKLEAIIRENPGAEQWWVEQEKIGKGRFVTEYSYSDLKNHVGRSPLLFDDQEHDVECGLSCAPIVEDDTEAGVTDDKSGVRSGEVKQTTTDATGEPPGQTGLGNAEPDPVREAGLHGGSPVALSDPIDRSLCEAHRARKIYPAGHSFAMTNPVLAGTVKTVGTCTCGHIFVFPGGDYERMDAAIEAHWQKFDTSPDKVDGRGHPIEAGDGAVDPKKGARRAPGKRRASPKKGDNPELAETASPEPALMMPCANSAGSPLSQPGAGGQSSAPIVADALQSSRQEPAPVAPPSGAGSLVQAAPIGAPVEKVITSPDDVNDLPNGDTASPPRHLADVGTDGAASASASQPSYLLAPADPATDEGASGDARSHAPPAFLSAPDFATTMAAEPSDDWPELFKAAHDLAWREPVKVTGSLAALLDFSKVYAAGGGKAERPVLRWHGGKWLLAPWIMSHFPPHQVYVEPFGGAASVLLRKPRAAAEVYNDLDHDVVNLFRVLQDEAKAARLRELLILTPFAREEFDLSYAPTDDDVETARRLIIRSFMGFGSNAHATAKTGRAQTGFRANSNRAGTTPARDWQNYPDCLIGTVERMRGVIIESRDALTVAASHDGEETLFYFDPPYQLELRNPGNPYDRKHMYRHELDREGHIALLEALKTLRGMVVLSGYPDPLYDDALPDWRRVEIDAFADGARARTEVLWLNPACVAALDAQHPQLFDLASFDAVNTPPSDVMEVEA